MQAHPPTRAQGRQGSTRRPAQGGPREGTSKQPEERPASDNGTMRGARGGTPVPRTRGLDDVRNHCRLCRVHGGMKGAAHGAPSSLLWGLRPASCLRGRRNTPPSCRRTRRSQPEGAQGAMSRCKAPPPGAPSPCHTLAPPQDLPVILRHEPVVTGLVSQYSGASVTQPWTRARKGAAATPPTALPSSAQSQDLHTPEQHRNAGKAVPETAANYKISARAVFSPRASTRGANSSYPPIRKH